MGALGDVARDFVEVELHHGSVGVGQREGRPGRPALGRSRRTDRRCRSAGRRAALAAFRAWPIAEPGRSSGRCGPRLQTRFRPASSRAGRRDEPSARAGSFFESLDGPLVLSWMTGPRTDVGRSRASQQLSDIAGMKVDAEPLGDDALEVEPTPAHRPRPSHDSDPPRRSARTEPVAPPTGAAWDLRSSCR